MANVQATFSATKSDGMQVLLSLKKLDGGPVIEMNFSNGDETKTLDTGKLYIARWDVVGALGNKLTVKCTSGNDSVTIIKDFKIDAAHVDARPWPGGKWFDRGVTGLEL